MAAELRPEFAETSCFWWFRSLRECGQIERASSFFYFLPRSLSISGYSFISCVVGGDPKQGRKEARKVVGFRLITGTPVKT